MKKTLNRILKIISSAIFVVLVILIIVILAYVIRVRYLASQNRLGEVRTNFYTILTQSMVPNIYPGDVVVTYKNMNNEYKNGDVLTYASDLNGGINITHRIIETYKVNGKYSYKTKGDNNSIPDSEIVKGERVLGKVIFKIPKIGFLQQFLVSKHRWIIIIVLPCLGIIIYDIIKMVKGFKKENEIEIPEVTNDIEQSGDGFTPPPYNNQINNTPQKTQENNNQMQENTNKSLPNRKDYNDLNSTITKDNSANIEQTPVDNQTKNNSSGTDDEDIEFL